MPLGDDRCVDSAANVEFGRQADKPWAEQGVQIVEYFIRDRFVKSASIAETPKIEFQGLELDAVSVGYVFKIQGREVWLAGFRAQASKFGDPNTDRVIPL